MRRPSATRTASSRSARDSAARRSSSDRCTTVREWTDANGCRHVEIRPQSRAAVCAPPASPSRSMNRETPGRDDHDPQRIAREHEREDGGLGVERALRLAQRRSLVNRSGSGRRPLTLPRSCLQLSGAGTCQPLVVVGAQHPEFGEVVGERVVGRGAKRHDLQAQMTRTLGPFEDRGPGDPSAPPNAVPLRSDRVRASRPMSAGRGCRIRAASATARRGPARRVVGHPRGVPSPSARAARTSCASSCTSIDAVARDSGCRAPPSDVTSACTPQLTRQPQRGGLVAKPVLLECGCRLVDRRRSAAAGARPALWSAVPVT